MSRITRVLLGILFGLFCLSCAAYGSTISITNPNFEAVAISSSCNFAYQDAVVSDCTHQDWNSAPGMGWTLSEPSFPGGSGLGSGLTNARGYFEAPTTFPAGDTQVLFLQSVSSASQSLSGFSPGNYVLGFELAPRAGPYYSGAQTVEALIDGKVIGKWTLVTGKPWALTTASFTVATGGTHTLEFAGLNGSGDYTAFLSNVAITSSAVPEPSSLLMLGSGVLGLGGLIRRKLSL